MSDERNWKVSVWDTADNLITCTNLPAESSGKAIDKIINLLHDSGLDDIGSADAEEVQ